MNSCEWCGVKLGLPARGRSPRFCSSSCRGKAHRASKPSIPSRMRSERRWVRAVGKRPVCPDGSPASSTNADTWSSFAEVQRGAGDGFGVMLGDGLGCIDLDHCLDSSGNVVTPAARELLDANPAAWVEVSQSGRGLHMFGLLEEGRGVTSPGFEVYRMHRFIRVTGNVFRPGKLVPLNV